MLQEIVCKFWNTKHHIGVDSNGNYIGKLNGKIKPVLKEVHAGAIHYRFVGTSKRVSKKQLNKKEFLVTNYTLQEYCPF